MTETKEIFWGPVPIIERTYNRNYDKVTGERLWWKCRSYHCQFYVETVSHCVHLGDFGTCTNPIAIEEGKKNVLRMLEKDGIGDSRRKEAAETG